MLSIYCQRETPGSDDYAWRKETEILYVKVWEPLQQLTALSPD